MDGCRAVFFARRRADRRKAVGERSGRKHKLLLELIQLRRAVPQTMVVRDIVKELLSVESPTEKKSEIPWTKV